MRQLTLKRTPLFLTGFLLLAVATRGSAATDGPQCCLVDGQPCVHADSQGVPYTFLSCKSAGGLAFSPDSLLSCNRACGVPSDIPNGSSSTSSLSSSVSTSTSSSVPSSTSSSVSSSTPSSVVSSIPGVIVPFPPIPVPPLFVPPMPPIYSSQSASSWPSSISASPTSTSAHPASAPGIIIPFPPIPVPPMVVPPVPGPATSVASAAASATSSLSSEKPGTIGLAPMPAPPNGLPPFPPIPAPPKIPPGGPYTANDIVWCCKPTFTPWERMSYAACIGSPTGVVAPDEQGIPSPDDLSVACDAEVFPQCNNCDVCGDDSLLGRNRCTPAKCAALNNGACMPTNGWLWSTGCVPSPVMCGAQDVCRFCEAMPHASCVGACQWDTGIPFWPFDNSCTLGPQC